MKKYIVIALTLLCAIALFGCGKKNIKVEDSIEIPVEEITVEEAEPVVQE